MPTTAAPVSAAPNSVNRYAGVFSSKTPTCIGPPPPMQRKRSPDARLRATTSRQLQRSSPAMSPTPSWSPRTTSSSATVLGVEVAS
jgi:hypothetical protein